MIPLVPLKVNSKLFLIFSRNHAQVSLHYSFRIRKVSCSCGVFLLELLTHRRAEDADEEHWRAEETHAAHHLWTSYCRLVSAAGTSEVNCCWCRRGEVSQSSRPISSEIRSLSIVPEEPITWGPALLMRPPTSASTEHTQITNTCSKNSLPY